MSAKKTTPRAKPPKLRRNANFRAGIHRLCPTSGRVDTNGPKTPRSAAQHGVAASLGKSPARNLIFDEGMEQDDLHAALRDLVAKIDKQQHSLADGIVEYKRRRLQPGLLKPVTIRVNTRVCLELGSEYGTVSIDADFVPIGAAIYRAHGRAAWPRLQVLRSVLLLARKLSWRSDPHGLGPLIKRCRYEPRDVVYSEARLDALQRALDRIDAINGCAPKREVIRLLIYTGLRVGEAVAIATHDVGEGYVRLRDSKTGPRTVALSPHAAAILARQVPRNGWVFPGRDKHVGKSTVQAAFREARDAAGIREGSVHTLRHSFATLAIKRGVPQRIVEEMLGHSSAWITRRYLHVTREDVARACAVVGKAIDGGAA